MRLSKRNMFYSVSKDSINIKGSLAFTEIRDATPLPDFSRSDECFTVDDAQRKEWTLCAESAKLRNKWVCMIKYILNKEELNICLANLDADENLPVVVHKITKPMIMIPLASPMCNEDFNYHELGSDWECDCREGIYL